MNMGKTQSTKENILSEIDKFIYDNSSGSCRPRERYLDIGIGELMTKIREIFDNNLK